MHKILCFLILALNRHPFHSLFSAERPPLLCISLMISLFKMAHQCNAEVLSGVPKCEKTIL